MSISMHDIRYLNTWEMVFQVAYITDDLCIITFFVPCLALLDACPTIISYTILNFFQAFAFFNFAIFFVFQEATASLHFIGSFFCVVQLAGHFWPFKYWFTWDIILCFSTAIPQFCTVPQVSAKQNYLLL